MSHPEDPPTSSNTIAGVSLIDDPDLRSFAGRELGEASRGVILVVEAARERPSTKVLEQAGFTVHATYDGVEGSQWLASMTFDAMVTDVVVGGLGGIELLRYAREHDADMPVLLMTGAPDVETAAAAVEHGAFQYLLKPFPNTRLVDAVEKAVRSCRAARAKSEALQALQELETVETSARVDRGRWDNALRTLWMAYQPIVLPSGKLYAYEALVRSEEPTMRGAGDLLDMAEALDGLTALGRTIRSRVGKFAAENAGRHYIFVNLHADDLLDDTLTSRDAPLAQVAPAVVLEITERAALHDIEEAKIKMAELRSMGFRIALDDLGAGYAGLTSFAHLRPEVVKLDMALVRDIDKDPVKRKLVKSVTEVSRDIGTLVVGEGVETEAERETLMGLGCHLLQGYLFGKPQKL
ncbi:MAG: EAL domain-containing protein [Polyangiaceae bacterium]|nr:EAL domain-containing protein [Polyangiaceae bacterium]